jgi:hypothetical protein
MKFGGVLRLMRNLGTAISKVRKFMILQGDFQSLALQNSPVRQACAATHEIHSPSLFLPQALPYARQPTAVLRLRHDRRPVRFSNNYRLCRR